MRLKKHNYLLTRAHNKPNHHCSLFFVLFSFLFSLSPLLAISFDAPSLLEPYMATAPEIVSQAAVLADAETGTVLYAKNPHEEIPPASLAKLMTIHLAMKDIQAGKVTLDEIIPVGVESWAQNQPPRSSLMFLAPGQIVTLRELILGLSISSGNDAAVAVALRIAPTVSEFASMMTEEARRMGLERTTFVEPSGVSEYNMTTAGEFTAFCREYLRLYPENLVEFHSVREFAYPKASNVAETFRNNPRTIMQANRNSLLRTFPGVDGLKTGYIDEAGYNIALTAERNNTRMVAVILGAPAGTGGDRIRDRDGERLLSWAFETFKTLRTSIAPLEDEPLWKGKAKWVQLQLADGLDLPCPMSFTVPFDRAETLHYRVEVAHPLIAPLPSHYPVGKLVFFDEIGDLYHIPVLTTQAHQQGNVFRRILDSIRLKRVKKGKR